MYYFEFLGRNSYLSVDQKILPKTSPPSSSFSDAPPTGSTRFFGPTASQSAFGSTASPSMFGNTTPESMFGNTTSQSSTLFGATASQPTFVVSRYEVGIGICPLAPSTSRRESQQRAGRLCRGLDIKSVEDIAPTAESGHRHYREVSAVGCSEVVGLDEAFDERIFVGVDELGLLSICGLLDDMINLQAEWHGCHDRNQRWPVLIE
ncbi:hypothetical protein BC936DRAFT_138374 [Jimgerdemannia flammicorona]|uniref:Uncharacterized protein n=1 Tax=Jimgerdemannia flammicorona TaxID=994334 RepID=A0A433CKQ2_9FUNG|nr:hypothetical protein BC936DRAFT_138374 [Jimgerdemannia flammicorona]